MQLKWCGSYSRILFECTQKITFLLLLLFSLESNKMVGAHQIVYLKKMCSSQNYFVFYSNMIRNPLSLLQWWSTHAHAHSSRFGAIFLTACNIISSDDSSSKTFIAFGKFIVTQSGKHSVCVAKKRIEEKKTFIVMISIKINSFQLKKIKSHVEKGK